jgi:hypothetical protein
LQRDAGPPYFQGLAGLLTSGQTPPNCRQCSVRVSEEWRDWLVDQGGRWAASPRLRRLAQRGSYTLVHAVAPGANRAVECLFHGLSPVELVRCSEVAVED